MHGPFSAPRRLRAIGVVVAIAALVVVPRPASAITDTDHDGLSDTFETGRSLTNPRKADTDGDGLRDDREDPDHDLLTNRQEQTTGTHPRRADTDGDRVRDDAEDPDREGLTNRYEFAAGTHPRKADTDADGVRDGAEDPDRDGLSNVREQTVRTNPRRADTDGDGTSDAREDPDGDGLWTITDFRAALSPRTPTRTAMASPTGSRTPTATACPTPWSRRSGRTPASATRTATGRPMARRTPTPTASRRSSSSRAGWTRWTGTRTTTAPSTATSRHPATPAPVLAGAPGCSVFPGTNVWNLRVDDRPVAANSATMVGAIGLTRTFHMDFGSYAGYGIPYQVTDGSTPRRTVAFDYADESDPGPYPIPASPLIEGGSDHHIITVDRDTCRLYELWDARLTADGGWAAGSGATWDLGSNALRPDGWTSADAAGLPILPGLVRYDEVAAGAILHALRFTAPQTRKLHVYPARHDASSSTSGSLPPMGLRVRLKAGADLTGLSPAASVIAVALQRYGMILADNGSPWYVSGMSDPRFDDDVLHELDRFTGADLEVVDTTGLVNGP